MPSNIQDFMRALFTRGLTGQTSDPIISVGGQNVSGSYVGVSFDANGNLLVSGGASGTFTSNVVASQSGSWTTAIFGQARTTDPAAAANGAIVPIITDSLGKQVVLPGSVNDLHLDGQTNIAQVAATPLIASQGTGKRVVLQNLLVTCSGSQTVLVVISGGPSARTFGYAFPGGGFQVSAGGSPLYITSASSDLSVAGDVTSTMNIFASGYSSSN